MVYLHLLNCFLLLLLGLFLRWTGLLLRVLGVLTSPGVVISVVQLLVLLFLAVVGKSVHRKNVSGRHIFLENSILPDDISKDKISGQTEISVPL